MSSYLFTPYLFSDYTDKDYHLYTNLSKKDFILTNRFLQNMDKTKIFNFFSLLITFPHQFSILRIVFRIFFIIVSL